MQLKPGEAASAAEMLDFLDGRIARWWTPDAVVFTDAIPLGATGKVDKKQLRGRYPALPIRSTSTAAPEHGHRNAQGS